MALIGRKKLYRRGFILAHLAGNHFAAQPGQGNAKDSILMRVLRNFSFRGIDAINQSQSRELASFDYVAGKRSSPEFLVPSVNLTLRFKPLRRVRSNEAPPDWATQTVSNQVGSEQSCQCEVLESAYVQSKPRSDAFHYPKPRNNLVPTRNALGRQ